MGSPFGEHLLSYIQSQMRQKREDDRPVIDNVMMGDVK
jgi:hypothetical protein